MPCVPVGTFAFKFYGLSAVTRLNLSVKISFLLVLLALCQTASSSAQCSLQPDVALQRRLEAIKAQILSKLGLSEPPNVSLHTSDVPADVLANYHALVNRRKRRSLDYAESISIEDYYHGRRGSVIPVSIQGNSSIKHPKPLSY